MRIEVIKEAYNRQNPTQERKLPNGLASNIFSFCDLIAEKLGDASKITGSFHYSGQGEDLTIRIEIQGGRKGGTNFESKWSDWPRPAQPDILSTL